MALAAGLNNYIFEYYARITHGQIRVGKWIKAIYKILVDGIKNGEYIFDAEKAKKAIDFIENFCHHSEGRNDLLKLELWQKAIVSAIFGILDKETGYRQFREVLILVARKNGKTLFASAIMAYMAYVDGEYGAKLYCLAPKLEQADLSYDAFYQIVQSDEELDQITKRRRSDIYIAEYNTSVKRLAFNSKKSDGFNPHFVLADEMEAWPGDQGLKQYEVMTSAIGARKQPLILSTSTAGYINDGIYDELIKRSTSFLKGSSKERRTGKIKSKSGRISVTRVLPGADCHCTRFAFKKSGVPYEVLQYQAEFFDCMAGICHGTEGYLSRRRRKPDIAFTG